MAGLSTYLSDALLAWIKGAAMPSAPSGLHVGLFTADPTDSGSTTNEVTATIRAAGRVAAPFGATANASGGGRQIANNAIVDFGDADGAPSGPLTHFAIFDAASGGNMLGSGSLGSVNVAAGNLVSFASGALVVRLD